MISQERYCDLLQCPIENFFFLNNLKMSHTIFRLAELMFFSFLDTKYKSVSKQRK